MSLDDSIENVTPIGHALERRKIELVNRSAQLEQESVFERDDLGYTSGLWTRFSLPYREPKPDVQFYERTSHNMTLSIGPARIVERDGKVKAKFPYGVLARQILLYITTQAKKQRSREIYLGDSFNEFIALIGAQGTSGKDRRRVQDHFMRLIKCNMEISFTGKAEKGRYEQGKKIDVTQSYELWLHDDDTPGQQALFGSRLLLSEQFFNTVIAQPLPIDMGALKALGHQGGAAMRIDIFVWLTARLHNLPKDVMVPWTSLKEQFGVEYKEVRFFKRDFLKNLEPVLTIYSKANVAITDTGLLLKPSASYIAAKDEKRILEQGT